MRNKLIMAVLLISAVACADDPQDPQDITDVGTAPVPSVDLLKQGAAAFDDRQWEEYTAPELWDYGLS